MSLKGWGDRCPEPALTSPKPGCSKLMPKPPLMPPASFTHYPQRTSHPHHRSTAYIITHRPHHRSPPSLLTAHPHGALLNPDALLPARPTNMPVLASFTLFPPLLSLSHLFCSANMPNLASLTLASGAGGRSSCMQPKSPLPASQAAASTANAAAHAATASMLAAEMRAWNVAALQLVQVG